MPKINYGKLPTEQTNPRTKNIDRLSTAQILTIINQEDHSVFKAVAKATPSIERGVEIIVRSIKKGGRLFFAGAGTSGRLGVIEAAECPPTFNTPPALVQAFMAGGKKAVFRSQEGAEDRRDEGFRILSKKLKKEDVLVGIAASGVTPFVRGAMEAAKKIDAATILITCNPSAHSKKLIDCLIAPRTGPEVISGSTRLKAGTATKLVLNMLTVTSMIQLGKVYQNWMVDLQPKSRKLKARALRLIEHLGGVSPQDADKHLRLARNQTKLAILMAKKRYDYKTACAKLKSAGGYLQKAISNSIE
ncbi:MAG TPA: N-acetylmuramic acid 6-phosphate etherase [bacterium]|nr:N-acetylmuramic acid 6-phosphate etherase [bacterium]